MRKVIIMAFATVIFNCIDLKTNAQEPNELDNVYVKEHVANRKPIPYPTIREADIFWSKRIWRMIDLRERINLPLYYPTTSMDDRYSLIDLLLYGIRYGYLNAYSTRDDEFKVLLNLDQVISNMGADSDTTEVLNTETGYMETKIVTKEVRTDEVKQILVKELWFFDRNHSRLDVRIIGLCPIREYVNDEGNVVKKQAFWINFSEVRPLFARYEIFNAGNDAQRRSFDDLFMSRFFGSYIVKESNIYNNRQIDTYAVGVEAMLESERVKYDIFRMEHDMWEF